MFFHQAFLFLISLLLFSTLNILQRLKTLETLTGKKLSVQKWANSVQAAHIALLSIKEPRLCLDPEFQVMGYWLQQYHLIIVTATLFVLSQKACLGETVLSKGEIQITYILNNII